MPVIDELEATSSATITARIHWKAKISVWRYFSGASIG
jgi:hypothetical protein